MATELQALGQFSETLFIFVMKILGAVAILVLGWLAAQLVSTLVKRATGRIRSFDTALANMLGRGSQWLVMGIAIVAVLSQFGIQTASIVAMLGAAGLTIGLALQGALSNVAAGVILIALRLFRVGDYVEVGGVEGTVLDLRLFTTELMRSDGVIVHLPNSSVWGGKISNFSQATRRRTEISIPVTPESDMRQAMEMISEILAKDPRIMATPAPLVNVGEVTQTHVVITAFYWTEPGNLRVVRNSTRQLILKSLPSAGIVLASNQPVSIRTIGEGE